MIKLFNYLTQHLLVRYIVSGGTAASINLLVFSFFYYKFEVYYLFSNIIAFSIAFLVSLTLQKFWTFQDNLTHDIHIQGVLYLANSLFGLGVNTLVLYICVDIFKIYPLLGVIISGVTTALVTFPISRKYIFNRDKLANKPANR